MKIPIAKPYLTEDEAQNAYDTILSGWVTQGPKVEQFEEQFAKYVGSKYAVAVSNCTSALQLALIVSGIGSGDEVICPSMSFIATANSIKNVGATPVFAEVGSDYNLNPDHAESLIGERTKAILLVHQIGMPANIERFQSICEKHDIKLIEDAACAIGSSFNGVKIGSHSDLVCFSFHPRKVITTGDGGMITTSNNEHLERLKLLRQHGMSVNDRDRHLSKTVITEQYLEVGYNFRMTDVQAAMGIKQLEKLDWMLEERRNIALQYHEAFKDIKWITVPTEVEGCTSNYQSYSITLEDGCPLTRDDLMQALLDKGIATRRGIMLSHKEPAYSKLYSGLTLPNSEKLSDSSILIPLYIPMKKEETDYVIDAIRTVL